MPSFRPLLAVALTVVIGTQPLLADDTPSRAAAVAALTKGVDFYRQQVAVQGGYVWRYSGDLKLKEGEATTGDTTIWVQPPGTPTVGEAYLDAFDALHEPRFLEAARDAADSLLKGQLESGGWNYSVEFDPQLRLKHAYRVDLRATGRKAPGADKPFPAGWEMWKQRRYKGNLTVLDDDTTQAALRFLMRFDQAVGKQDERLHEAVEYGLASLLGAQYPNGAWSHCYDQFPHEAPSAETYPVLKASYPKEWSTKWTKDWTGCYKLNDGVTTDLIMLMLAAGEAYDDDRYHAAACRGGEFLLLAQMPAPQPAWAQQYDRAMHPVWDRKFEPPAISGLESQDVLETLISLFHYTGDRKYLQPISPATNYLNQSLLPTGQLARFYRLPTNEPMYFTRDYQLTRFADNLPRHYSFNVESRLENIARRYRDAYGVEPKQWVDPASAALARRVQQIIDTQDQRGAWVEKIELDAHDVAPESGVIQSRTFADNIRVLSQYVKGRSQ